MDLAGGQGQLLQQRLVGHAVVRILVVGRHAALVAPEELHLRPVHVVAEGRFRQQLIQPPRCRAAGHGDDKLAARRDGVAGAADEFLRRGPAHLLCVGELTNGGLTHDGSKSLLRY